MSLYVDAAKTAAEAAVAAENSRKWQLASQKYLEAKALLDAAIAGGAEPKQELQKMADIYQKRVGEIDTSNGRNNNSDKPPAYNSFPVPPSGGNNLTIGGGGGGGRRDDNNQQPISINISTISNADGQGGSGGSSNATNTNTNTQHNKQVSNLKASNRSLTKQVNDMKQEQTQRQEQWQKQSQWQAQFGGCGRGWGLFWMRPNCLLLIAMLLSVACFIMTWVALVSTDWETRRGNLNIPYGIADLELGLLEFCFKVNNDNYDECYELHQIDRMCADYFNITSADPDAIKNLDAYDQCQDWLQGSGDVIAVLIIAAGTQLVVASIAIVGFFFIIPFPFHNPRLGFPLEYGTCTGSIFTLYKVIFLLSLAGFILYMTGTIMHAVTDISFFGATSGNDGLSKSIYDIYVADVYGRSDAEGPEEIRWEDWEKGSSFDQSVACIILTAIVTILFGNIWRHQRTGQGCCGYGKKGYLIGHVPFNQRSFYI